MNEVNAHKLVAETAKSMAHELYDQVMRDNKLYNEWKRKCPELTPKILEDKFVALAYPKLLEAARATLARMLSGSYPEELKETIVDALVKDKSLLRGRPAGRQHIQIH